MEQEFSEQEVHDIVAAALASLETNKVLPLSFCDSALLKKLYELLPKYVGTYSDAQYIISQLREEIYSNVAVATVQKIHTVANNCVRCPNKTQSATMPLWNFNNPDLLIIVENPYSLEDPANVRLLVDALKRAGFNSQSICVSYATRCKFSSAITPDNFASCSSFCYNEIHALQPKLTIAFGSAVWGVVCGDDSMKIKEVKGEIMWMGSTALMPTYSLSYFNRAYKDKEDVVSYLETDLKKAYSFCYGDNKS